MILTSEEKLRLLLKKGTELLTDHLKKNVPESGRFQPYFCTCDIPGTQNACRMQIEPWLPGGAEGRVLQLGALRKHTDMLVSCYMKNGTKAELLDYLSEEATVGEWYDKIRDLSERVDEKW